MCVCISGRDVNRFFSGHPNRRRSVVRRTRHGGEQVGRRVQLLPVRFRGHAQVLGTVAQFHILLGEHHVRPSRRGGHHHTDVRRILHPAVQHVGVHVAGHRAHGEEDRQHTGTRRVVGCTRGVLERRRGRLRRPIRRKVAV